MKTIQAVFLISLVLLLSVCGKKQQEQPLHEQLFVHATDIGNPALPGNFSFDNQTGVYTLTGAGENMWYGSDEFFFAYDSLEGDFSLSAKIAFEGEGVNPHRKVGLMIRESLESDSRYADITVHYGDGLTSLQYRPTSGADTEEIRTAALSPDYLTLERKGNCIIAKVANGDLSDEVAAELTIELPSQCYVGLFICSHEATVKETGYFSEVNLHR
jgi:hypothetical protein